MFFGNVHGRRSIKGAMAAFSDTPRARVNRLTASTYGQWQGVAAGKVHVQRQMRQMGKARGVKNPKSPSSLKATSATCPPPARRAGYTPAMPAKINQSGRCCAISLLV